MRDGRLRILGVSWAFERQLCANIVPHGKAVRLRMDMSPHCLDGWRSVQVERLWTEYQVEPPALYCFLCMTRWIAEAGCTDVGWRAIYHLRSTPESGIMSCSNTYFVLIVKGQRHSPAPILHLSINSCPFLFSIPASRLLKLFLETRILKTCGSTSCDV
jgi:hypothetical protein